MMTALAVCALFSKRISNRNQLRHFGALIVNIIEAHETNGTSPADSDQNAKHEHYARAAFRANAYTLGWCVK